MVLFPVEIKSLYVFEADKDESGDFPKLLFTENESKVERILGRKKRNKSQFVKDAFHQYIIKGNLLIPLNIYEIESFVF